MDMSATCVMCGKKSQDYAIECSCCGNFFCSEECKVRAIRKGLSIILTLIINTYMKE